MENADLELIDRWKDRHPELKKLWDEHIELEEQLERFNARVYLSGAEQLERKMIQKKKLQGRDRIEKILVQLRRQPDAHE